MSTPMHGLNISLSQLPEDYLYQPPMRSRQICHPKPVDSPGNLLVLSPLPYNLTLPGDHSILRPSLVRLQYPLVLGQQRSRHYLEDDRKHSLL